MIKIIFLDIDGVLVSYKSACQFGHYRTFLPSSVDALNHILESTGAQIVISSAWRIQHDFNELKAIFSQQGIDSSKIIDTTPRTASRLRGDEIGSWLKTFEGAVKSFIIIDDDSDMTDYPDQLVKTTFEDGLTMAHANMAIKMLSS